MPGSAAVTGTLALRKLLQGQLNDAESFHDYSAEKLSAIGNRGKTQNADEPLTPESFFDQQRSLRSALFALKEAQEKMRIYEAQLQASQAPEKMASFVEAPPAGETGGFDWVANSKRDGVIGKSEKPATILLNSIRDKLLEVRNSLEVKPKTTKEAKVEQPAQGGRWF
ncbi:unnamed protein product [Amoebophrya sp. A120]|nr:unnamed protein product [Amoebophrya sp. A120]|eukprot:GSA120T00018320001.1